jgi:hypothetical protein
MVVLWPLELLSAQRDANPPAKADSMTLYCFSFRRALGHTFSNRGEISPEIREVVHG